MTRLDINIILSIYFYYLTIARVYSANKMNRL